MKTKLLLLILILGLGISCGDDSEDPVLSTETAIISFSFTEATGAATINSSNHTIDVEVANGNDRTDLSPTFSLSTGATSVPSSGSSGDYSSAFTITVTAEDATTQDWTVNVTAAAALSNATDILTFSIPTETGAATIDASAHTIATEMPNGTDLATLIPEFTLSAGATSAPESGIVGDYSSAFTITVTAEDETTTQDWTVNVTAAAAGGPTTVEFADGGVKATAIRNLVVDGVTYDVEFKHAYPQQIYGDYPGTYTFTSNTDASAAINAIDDALNSTDATTVGEKDKVDDDRYRIGLESLTVLEVQNTRFRSGVFDTSWLEGFGDSVLYNADPSTFAVFTEL